MWKGFNDLQSCYPELAKQWNYAKNVGLLPEEVTSSSGLKVWWILPYDDPNTGKHFDFEWKATVASRTGSKAGCPYLTGGAVWPGYNDLQTLFPELARQWHLNKNDGLTPDKVIASSTRKAWWILPYDEQETGEHFEFEWEASIASRTDLGAGCPYLAGKAVWPKYNDLETKEPRLAKELDEKRNRGKTAYNIYYRSSKKVWWKCPECGSSWRASVYHRAVDGSGCPECIKRMR